MEDIKQMCNIIEDEIRKIADKGLTSSNLETAYKLIDMLKDIKNIEYWACKSRYYSEEMGDDYDDGYSGDHMRKYPTGRDSDRTMSRGRRYDGGYDDDRSYARGRRRRDSRGRYMREYSGAAYDDYISAKNQYRQSKDSGCKARMLEMLDEYLTEFSEDLNEMSRDADCQEERQTIQKHMDKLRSMMA